MSKDMNEEQSNEGGKSMVSKSWIGILIRFVIAAVVLMITSFLTPGFEGMGFGTAILAALVIAGLSYLLQSVFKLEATPFGRGITGFLLTALIIYLAQFVVPGMQINMIGALIAALIIGIVDALIPVEVF